MLIILLNLSLDTSYKYKRFSKVLLKKRFKLVLNKRNNTVAFNLNLVILSTKINLILEKKDCKKCINSL